MHEWIWKKKVYKLCAEWIHAEIVCKKLVLNWFVGSIAYDLHARNLDVSLIQNGGWPCFQRIKKVFEQNYRKYWSQKCSAKKKRRSKIWSSVFCRTLLHWNFLYCSLRFALKSEFSFFFFHLLNFTVEIRMTNLNDLQAILQLRKSRVRNFVLNKTYINLTRRPLEALRSRFRVHSRFEMKLCKLQV